MRLHRFYIPTPITEKVFDITDRNLIHQWRSVFRYNVGSQVILFDGSGTDYHAMITSLRNLGATVSVFDKIQTFDSRARELWLCMSLIKKDNFEWVAEKATELGVAHIVPILSERTEKKKINKERLQKIVVEASEQSGRGDVPVIHEVDTLLHILEERILPEDKIALHFTPMTWQKYTARWKENESLPPLVAFIGPEGGWGEDEIKMFESHQVPLVSLGAQVLRAETAAIALASIFLIAE